MDLNDRVISIWQVVYDESMDQSYVFTDLDLVLNSILTAVREYLDPLDTGSYLTADGSRLATKQTVGQLVDLLRAELQSPFVRMAVSGLDIVVQRIDLDRHHPVHTLLRRARDVLKASGPDGGRLAVQVEAMFQLLLDSE